MAGRPEGDFCYGLWGRMTFDPTTLAQSRPRPVSPRPIVIFGAGSIVGDAHFPAYRKGGFPVAGLYDPDQDKAKALAETWGVTAYRSVEEAIAVENAGRPDAAIIEGTLETIGALLHDARPAGPVVILIGEVAGLRAANVDDLLRTG